MSRVTGVSRATDSANAYLYSGQDSEKMQEINDALQKYNPALVGSQIIAADKFDAEASVISSAKKDGDGRVLPKNQMKELR